MKKYLLLILCLSLSGCFVCRKPYMPDLEDPDDPPVVLFQGASENQIINEETPYQKQQRIAAETRAEEERKKNRVSTAPAAPEKVRTTGKPAPVKNQPAKKSSPQYVPETNMILF